MSLAIASVLAGCNSRSSSDTTIAKPSLPSGVGYELTVPVPGVAYPLPMVENAPNNSNDPYRYDIDHNPLTHILSGMNKIWHAGVDGWQNNANGDGPETFDETILDHDVWAHNIQYVVDVTTNRTLEQAIESYTDDRRSKNYSVIDGFGPLTQAYLDASDAYVDIDVPTVKDILENDNFFAVANDGGDYTGDESKELGSVVKLVRDFRDANASTNPSKYIYSTPRPWRMDSVGQVDYLGTVEHECIQQDGSVEARIYDTYTSDVEVLPGIYCAGRHHGNDPVTEDHGNRRKDGGYPSGHTNAGYLAAMGYAYAMPERFAEFITRGSQMGENRVLTGMHSPVDVIGARIHFQAIVAGALAQDDVYTNAQQAYNHAGVYFGNMAREEGYELFDYAHRHVEDEVGFVDGEYAITVVGDNNRYADHELNKKTYRERMTYGFEQDLSLAGQEAIVPKGAERLLETRLPYLSDEQRRAVLYTTSIDSGYPILDDTNGWGRLDLVMAADGFGSFVKDVDVTMSASAGRFNAKDTWRNDIDGLGKLTKSGTGHLNLIGDNSYTGGTVLKDGTLEASSSSALGQGDVYIVDGLLLVSSIDGLKIGGSFTQQDGSLIVNIDNNEVSVEVAETLYIEEGKLELHIADSISAGQTINLITAKRRSGEFTEVDAGSRNVELSYTEKGVQVTVL
ncbi:serine protease [Vibrio comitans NBRC 102076]|uniref:Serine protease n=1 Tax=Vibrio comitans NBRC 102076 TaxID=1219078 RepID=A0A4Y3ISV6_9VIBR|nr:serine protease [Vibrio comitans NBRC 102076]